MKTNKVCQTKKDLYYLPNRGIFVNFINRLFEPYKKKLSSQDKAECGTNKGDFKWRYCIEKCIIS